MFDDLAARDSAEKQAAAIRIANIISVGKSAQADILKRVLSTEIVDKLVPPKEFRFHPTPVDKLRLSYTNISNNQRITVHRNALQQVAAVVRIPLTYVNRLSPAFTKDMDLDDAYELVLLCENLNTLLHRGEYRDRKGNPTKHLHRFVGNELRGFLSRSYNRELSNKNLLRPFIEECAAQGAQPIGGTCSDVAVSLQYVLPYIFEPVPGEFIAFGVTFKNSDFGRGKERVSGTCLRIKSGTVSVTADALSRVHLGSLIEEADIELSEQTTSLELQTHQSAVRDTVKAVLAPDSVDRMLQTIEQANERQITWSQLRLLLSKAMTKSEVEGVGKILDGEPSVVDLPPLKEDGKATAWWAATIVGAFAQGQTDAERQLELQTLAGTFLK